MDDTVTHATDHWMRTHSYCGVRFTPKVNRSRLRREVTCAECVRMREVIRAAPVTIIKIKNTKDHADE